MDLTIFCPQCDALILDAPGCPSCRWRRPAPAEAGTQLWQYNAASKLRCTSLELVGGRLLFGDAGSVDAPGAVHAVEAERGECLWRTPLPLGAPSERLAVGDGMIFVSAVEAGDLSPDKPLLALDIESGKVVWTYQSGALNVSAPLVHGGLVYVVSSDQMLHAVDQATGKRCWTAELSGWGRASPAAGEGLLFLGTEQNRLLALERSDGRERWSHEGEGWFASTPTLHKGQVYAACWDGTLYALEALTGRETWRFALGAHAYLLSSPVAAGERVLVGSRDHSLYSVDRHTGEVAWCYETKRRVYAEPAVAHGLVYVGSDDRHLHALDEHSGELKWKVELPGRIRTSPLVVGHHLYVACTSGVVVALAPETEEGLETPEQYMGRGEYAQAAAVLALAGDWAAAGLIHAEELDEPLRAARLYERGGEWLHAAREYEKAGQPERALALWRELGESEAVIRILQATGQVLQAAQELERTGQLEEAARIYDEELDQPAKAAELYHQAGKWLRALKLFGRVGNVGAEIDLLLKQRGPKAAADRYEELGEYARAAELYVEAGEPALAAAIWSDRGEHRKAAELYAQAGALDQAAAAYEKAGAWTQAADLYLQLGEPLEAARCFEALSKYIEAGSQYEEMALKLEEESRGKAERRLADLFERAANCFAHEFEIERRDGCRQKVRFYRRQPVLTLALTQDEAFVQDSPNTLTLELVNEGRGVARNVEVALVPAIEATFSGELRKQIQGIGRFRPRRDTLAVLPKAPGKLTLDVQVRYQDRKGAAFEEQGRWFVDVRTELGTGRFTPQEIHVHDGDYVVGGKVTGDYIADGGQKGDKVVISRGTQLGAKPATVERRHIICTSCQTRQSVGAAFCERCGTRLEGQE